MLQCYKIIMRKRLGIMDTGFISITSLDDIELNSNRAFDVAGRSVLVCHTVSGVYAVENLCSHQASTLEGGKVKAHYLFCPLHGARFDMRDGSTKGKLTKTAIATFETRVMDGMIEVKI